MGSSSIQRGPVYQRPHQRYLLLHASGVAADWVWRGPGHLEHIQERLYSLFSLVPGTPYTSPMKLRYSTPVVSIPQRGLSGTYPVFTFAAVGCLAKSAPPISILPSSGLQDSDNHLDRGRLACPWDLGTEYLPRANVKVEAVNCLRS